MHITLFDQPFSLRRNRFLLLLVSLLVLILIAPAILVIAYGRVIFSALAFAILIIAIYEIPERKKHMKIAVFLATAAIITHLLRFYYPTTPMVQAIDATTSSIFLIFISVQIIHQMFNTHIFSLSTIFGAMCIYILIGFVFGHFYALIQSFDSNAFMIESLRGEPVKASTFKLFVFSYSILTTVGHTRVYTNNLFADSVAIIEQLLGVMYLAVLISRLVTGFSVRYQRILSTKMRHHHEYGKMEAKKNKEKPL